MLVLEVSQQIQGFREGLPTSQTDQISTICENEKNSQTLAGILSLQKGKFQSCVRVFSLRAIRKDIPRTGNQTFIGHIIQQA